MPPRDPRRFNPALPRDVAIIALKCLEKRPEARYENAAELAFEIERFLGGHPIHARPQSRLYRAQLFIARNALAVLLVVSLFAAVSVGGAASAWFAGPARIPFVAGIDHALPAALGRVHPRWGSPHIALITCALFSAGFTALSLTGSSVAEAYQVLLRASVVINLVPFVYTFLALLTLDTAGLRLRASAAVGATVTTAGILAAFLPGDDVANAGMFEWKMAAGVLGPIGLGLWLYWRSRRRAE